MLKSFDIRFIGVFFAIFIASCSCSKIGDYYAFDKKGDIESMLIFDNQGLKIRLSANLIDTVLTTSLIARTDSESNQKNFKLEDIELTINDQKELNPDKSVRRIDTAGVILFDNFSDLSELDRWLSKNLPCTFEYKYNSSLIKNTSHLSVEYKIRYRSGGQDSIITKTVKLSKFERYRSWHASN